jgi:hypothetical protein
VDLNPAWGYSPWDVAGRGILPRVTGQKPKWASAWWPAPKSARPGRPGCTARAARPRRGHRCLPHSAVLQGRMRRVRGARRRWRCGRGRTGDACRWWGGLAVGKRWHSVIDDGDPMLSGGWRRPTEPEGEWEWGGGGSIQEKELGRVELTEVSNGSGVLCEI